MFDGDPNTAFYGTPGLLAPGGSETTIADLPAGNYAFVCFLPSPDGQPHFSLGMAKDFTVADSGGTTTPPETDGTITITADKITAPDGMKSGTYEVTNSGSDPSDFNMAGPTDKQVSDFDDAVNGYFASIGTGETQPFSVPRRSWAASATPSRRASRATSSSTSRRVATSWPATPIRTPARRS